MKTINVKIPLKIAEDMDNRARLNPQWMTSFIIVNWSYASLVNDRPIEGLSYNYAFKVDSDIHRMVKLKAVEMDLPMNELLGRLLSSFYKGR